MNFGIICDLFIASSSDCEKAKPIIAQACYEWNQVHGHKEKVFILPRFCEVDGHPALCRPQDQLNKVLDQCDIAVALVWYKFANGLREELERSIQQQKKLLVYFSEQGISPKKFNEANIDAIENFKSSYQENVYWWSYESDAQLAELFKRQLQQTMNDLLENEIADYKSELDALSKENQVPLNAVNNSNAPTLNQLITEDPYNFIRDFGDRRGREIYREYITPEKLPRETLKALENLSTQERAAFVSLFDGLGCVVEAGSLRVEGLDLPAYGIPSEEDVLYDWHVDMQQVGQQHDWNSAGGLTLQMISNCRKSSRSKI